MLKNVQPAPPEPTTTTTTDASDIRAALEQAGIEVGPDPGKDGDWAARVVVDDELHDLVAFGNAVKSVKRGTMEMGKLVSIVDGRLVVEGVPPAHEAWSSSVDPASTMLPEQAKTDPYWRRQHQQGRVLVGFWRGSYQDEDLREAGAPPLPDPNEHCDPKMPQEVRDRIADALDRGYVLERYRGWSDCRICGEANGSCDLGGKSGRYAWPEGLGHYVRKHGLVLPEDFLKAEVGILL